MNFGGRTRPGSLWSDRPEPGLSAWLTGAVWLAIVFYRAEMNRHHSAARDHTADSRRYPTIEPVGGRLSSFRVYLRRLAAGYGSPLELNQEKLLLLKPR
jgi:hypothetical protein